jgi:predicted RNA-binding protein associated with RNAse of E/G family
LIHYHYDRPGKGTITYVERLLLERGDVLVTLLPAYEGPPVLVDGRVVQEPGAPIVWFLFPGEWYGVGRFHLADGTFTGWYTNITEPVRIEGDQWYGTDLFLDYWQAADGGPGMWLDEEELAAAALTSEQLAGIAQVRELVKQGPWPPRVTLTQPALI